MINCPNCGAKKAEARTGLVTEISTFFFVPVWRAKMNLVRCTQCNALIRSRIPVAKLAGLAPEELEKVLAVRLDVVALGVTMFAMFLLLIPAADVVVSLLAMLLGRRGPNWLKFTNVLVLVLSMAYSLVFLARVKGWF